MQGSRRLALLAAGIAAVIAVTILNVPLGTILVIGVLLLCPLMMAGMHGGQGRTHAHGAHPTERDADEQKTHSH